ncbi:hypothetical protein NDU88_000023 [Pleurodeles waltl]|uniref:Secreted protein n=1 Tax=Pleurodeles waltl TaxID=8319 RepID=A0AAV7WE78_PLEWA|nr:hypothetical protein NDU88_000023 [Pleurodeles waltl]
MSAALWAAVAALNPVPWVSRRRLRSGRVRAGPVSRAEATETPPGPRDRAQYRTPSTGHGAPGSRCWTFKCT